MCVGSLRFQKDQITLMRAMAIVRDRCPAAHLIVVGDARDEQYERSVTGEVARLHLESSVSFVGFRSDVGAVLAGCDVGVLSSVSEAFPLALLEYGTAGLASVATRVGQCAELLDEGRDGRLVHAGDPAALADAICGLLNNPAARRTLGNRFQARVQQRYSPEAVVSRIGEIYDTVLACRARPRRLRHRCHVPDAVRADGHHTRRQRPTAVRPP